MARLAGKPRRGHPLPLVLWRGGGYHPDFPPMRPRGLWARLTADLQAVHERLSLLSR